MKKQTKIHIIPGDELVLIQPIGVTNVGHEIEDVAGVLVLLYHGLGQVLAQGADADLVVTLLQGYREKK